jgi:hypothetical protein
MIIKAFARERGLAAISAKTFFDAKDHFSH